MRLDVLDIKGRIEDSLVPPRRSNPHWESWIGADEFRLDPIGVDSGGTSYYFQDHSATSGSVRLYTSTPSYLPAPMPSSSCEFGRGADEGLQYKKSKKAKQPYIRGSDKSPPREVWRCEAVDCEGVQAVSDQLYCGRNKEDRRIASWLVDGVVAKLMERAEKEKRRHKAVQKLKLDTANIILDTGGGLGRSRRNRKEVNYNFKDFDKTMEDAIKDVAKPTARLPPIQSAAPPSGRKRGRPPRIPAQDSAEHTQGPRGHSQMDYDTEYSHSRSRQPPANDQYCNKPRYSENVHQYDSDGNEDLNEEGREASEYSYEPEPEPEAPPHIPRDIHSRNQSRNNFSNKKMSQPYLEFDDNAGQSSEQAIDHQSQRPEGVWNNDSPKEDSEEDYDSQGDADYAG